MRMGVRAKQMKLVVWKQKKKNKKFNKIILKKKNKINTTIWCIFIQLNWFIKILLKDYEIIHRKIA